MELSFSTRHDNTLEAVTGVCGKELTGILSEDGGKKQIVGQTELLPAVLARRVWNGKLRGTLVVHFVDNEAARLALIKGSSPTTDSAWLTGEFWQAEAGSGAFSWFERVPSPSNPSDSPSRGEREVNVGLGLRAVAKEASPEWERDLVERWVHDVGFAQRARG